MLNITEFLALLKDSVLMSYWATDTLVAVYPFTRQPDGNEVVIGQLDTAVFLVIPSEALELLDCLAIGMTVGQAQLFYQQKYDEVPDIEDLLNLLESKGFVRPLIAGNFMEITATNPSHLISRHRKPKSLNYHFVNFPQSLARKLFSRPMLVSSGVLIGLAICAIAVDPAIIPDWNAYFFPKNWALMSLLLMVMGFLRVFLHEMAHLIAARSLGIFSRLGISHRLWILVAETDMTGIWAVPRKQRYLPLLAGPLLDAISSSVLLLVFFADNRGWILLPGLIGQLGQAILLTYLLGILWQCYFFVRTDFYYVIANFFRCKNLMKDTEIFLHNQLGQIIHSIRQVDQSHIKASEMRVIRVYAIVWLLGRALAFSSLLFIGVPVFWNYCLAFFTALGSGIQIQHYKFIDALIIGLIFIPQLIGFWLWITSRRKAKG
ncbi:hypothetical protein [Halotia branconii]|uniref:Uncharacterized protein n=1 Tax=Halotia branconii CENA392 TaxID=1539056 RepID=A0AAJ6P854_9CYAN|nr:hypothetical protein [Halotia branconii]WGV24434.1 hypothetical protein QI031_22015 [Halotia branconii CENA392]